MTSKIRGRAELGLYLRLNTASNPLDQPAPGPLEGNARRRRSADRRLPAEARLLIAAADSHR